MVSATPTCSTPMSRISRATSPTLSGVTSPWYGQPSAQEIAPRTRIPALVAAAATGRKRSIDSAMLQLMFRCENASLAAPKTTTSSAFAASARSKPCMFGTSTE